MSLLGFEDACAAMWTIGQPWVAVPVIRGG
jgi:hypothetical protein